MDKLGNRLLLFDVYGGLLTDKQQQTLDLIYNEDLSLGEVAGILHISRQAVYDTQRRSEDLLREYDEKLNLVRRYEAEKRIVRDLAAAEKAEDWQAVAGARDALSGMLAD